MNPPFNIVEIDRGKGGRLYSIVISDSHETELDKFLSDKWLRTQKGFNKVERRLIDMVDKTGFNQNFFRNEGTPQDPVDALAKHKLRLYCCRWSQSILIAGCGGLKNVRTYQEDPILNQHVITLQYVGKKIEERIKTKEITIPHDGGLAGDLNFREEDY